MAEGTGLADALTREHREIDEGIEAFLASLDGSDAPDAAPLQRAMRALRRHIYLEERILFPPLREAGMTMPIFVMLKEHGRLWRAMDALDDALGKGTDAAVLRERCQSMLGELAGHNSKEEPIVYPHADADLADFQREQLAQFLADGTFPDGWVCERAAS
ncbi:hemerythrin domain-containing protein [Microbacterium sp.]|uniref:hemerythrin domain-containing protein n=1 Tax=Microbacterium sp. TaxID=51671 RepID=UPI0037C90628